MTILFDDIPPDVRRLNFGWFGSEPWPSDICFDNEGRVNEAMRIPVPVGQNCFDCQEPFLEVDQGKAMPYVHDGGTTITYVHKECMIVQIVGPLAHLDRRCVCFGGESHETEGMTRREEALAVWQRVSRGEF